jgi:signal transduction histidine kinase
LLAEVNLKDLLTEVSWDAEVLCEEKAITFKSDLCDASPSNFVVKGDKPRLREVFLNLLNNAVRYTPSGAKITLSLDKDGSFARISLSDTGIGISNEHLPHIFERFYRVDSKGDGVGLGLAICKRIVDLHRGTIEAHSKLGVGTTFNVRLPLAEDRGG